MGNFVPTESADPKFQVEGVAPTNHSSCQKTKLSDLSYDIKIWTHPSFILSQITRLTDGCTDSLLVASLRLHSMQCGKSNHAYKVSCKKKTNYLENTLTVHLQHKAIERNINRKERGHKLTLQGVDPSREQIRVQVSVLPYTGE